MLGVSLKKMRLGMCWALYHLSLDSQILMDEVEKLFHIYKVEVQPKFKHSLANQRAEHLSAGALLWSLKTKSLK